MNIKNISNESFVEHNSFIQGGKAAAEEDGSLFDKVKAGAEAFVETAINKLTGLFEHDEEDDSLLYKVKGEAFAETVNKIKSIFTDD